MIAIRRFFAVAAFLCCALPMVGHAQATRTWVSGVGDDVNPCSRTAPCKTFAGAISKTAASGEISCLDPGGFGSVTISKSIAIICDETTSGGILATGTYGVTISSAVAAADRVYLSGLDIEGAGSGIQGIRMLGAGTLHLHNVSIRRFTQSGIQFAPSGPAKLLVTDSEISGNAPTSLVTGVGGIVVQPSGAGSAVVSLSNVKLQNNFVGFRADGTGSSGGISASISECDVTGNLNNGIASFTPAGGASTSVMVSRTTVSGNGGKGLSANGAAAILRVGGSTISGNAGGNAQILGGATLTSYGNNQIDDNGAGGTLIPGGSLQ